MVTTFERGREGGREGGRGGEGRDVDTRERGKDKTFVSTKYY